MSYSINNFNKSLAESEPILKCTTRLTTPFPSDTSFDAHWLHHDNYSLKPEMLMIFGTLVSRVRQVCRKVVWIIGGGGVVPTKVGNKRREVTCMTTSPPRYLVTLVFDWYILYRSRRVGNVRDLWLIRRRGCVKRARTRWSASPLRWDTLWG